MHGLCAVPRWTVGLAVCACSVLAPPRAHAANLCFAAAARPPPAGPVLCPRSAAASHRGERVCVPIGSSESRRRCHAASCAMVEPHPGATYWSGCVVCEAAPRAVCEARALCSRRGVEARRAVRTVLVGGLSRGAWRIAALDGGPARRAIASFVLCVAAVVATLAIRLFDASRCLVAVHMVHSVFSTAKAAARLSFVRLRSVLAKAKAWATKSAIALFAALMCMVVSVPCDARTYTWAAEQLSMASIENPMTEVVVGMTEPLNRAGSLECSDSAAHDMIPCSTRAPSLTAGGRLCVCKPSVMACLRAFVCLLTVGTRVLSVSIRGLVRLQRCTCNGRRQMRSSWRARARRRRRRAAAAACARS
jgi:hypothetical protein